MLGIGNPHISVGHPAGSVKQNIKGNSHVKRNKCFFIALTER